MDPSVSFAKHSDLEDRWHKLLPEERVQADILLADASEIIRNRVRPYPETHDQRVTLSARQPPALSP